MLSVLVTAVDAALLAFALGGTAALLSHARALTLIALWGVSSFALAFLRPVRDQDVERSDPEPPLVLVALFLIPLLTPALSAWGSRIGFGVLPLGTVWPWSGVVLVAAGLALRIVAMVQLGPRFSPRLAVQRDHALETRGLYAWMRHPGYAGALLANLGAALAFSSLVGLLATAALGVLMGVRAGREERLLRDRFGAEYERYRARTGRFLPRLAPPRERP